MMGTIEKSTAAISNIVRMVGVSPVMAFATVLSRNCFAF
jgi:hypothetical protein